MTELTPAGNHRLTTSVGLVLLVLLGVEALTTLALGTYLSLHIFLGLLLLPPVSLKLASTGWRFVRYYMGTSCTGSRGRRGFCCGCLLRRWSPPHCRFSEPGWR